MDTHMTFKEHYNRCVKKARAAEARLRILTQTYGVVPDSVLAIQVVWFQGVALYANDLWWYHKEVGRRDNLQLLLNQQARSVLGAMPTTPRGSLMRESWLTPTPVILDSRQHQFAARLANTCSSKVNELHEDPIWDTLVC